MIFDSLGLSGGARGEDDVCACIGRHATALYAGPRAGPKLFSLSIAPAQASMTLRRRNITA